MKFNPKINEWAARLPGFAALHPLAPDALAQGTLELLWELERWLVEISGMTAATLQPAAGAHGELTGILMIRAYHLSRGDTDRLEVIVPDSSHGTNPATASMAGFKTVTIPSDADGQVDLDALQAALGPRTAAVMLTNPSTLGLFEKGIGEVLEAVHAAGALAYMDGANMNAILGKFKPGQAGFDVMHFNTHKTFSTPHGGGGPGAGPVAVNDKLVPFLPWPRVLREGRAALQAGARGRAPVVNRPGPVVPGQRRRPRARVRVHAGARRQRAGAGQRGRGACRELPAPSPGRRLRDALRPGQQARVRRHRRRRIKAETGVRMLDIAKRLIDYGYPPADDLLPADRRGGHARRADRDGIARDARRLRRRA